MTIKGKKIQAFLCMLMLVLVSSCQIVVVDTGDDLTEGAWAGDVGMTDDFGEAVYSVFEFYPGGRGIETQFYMYDDAFYDKFSFFWEWRHGHREIVLDYGHLGISYMDHLDFFGRTMTGVYYIDEYDSTGFPFRLHREY